MKRPYRVYWLQNGEWQKRNYGTIEKALSKSVEFCNEHETDVSVYIANPDDPSEEVHYHTARWTSDDQEETIYYPWYEYDGISGRD